jgi:hypothetical protein
MRKKKTIAQNPSTVRLTPEDRAAMAYIKSQRPELKHDADIFRSAIHELARRLNWNPAKSSLPHK